MATQIQGISIVKEELYDDLNIYLGKDDVTQKDMLVYKIKNRIHKKTKQFIQYHQVSHLPLVDRIIKVQHNYYVSIILDNQFQQLDKMVDITEVDVWRWIEQLAKKLICFYENQIIITHINTKLLYYDVNTKDIQLFDYSSIKECCPETTHEPKSFYSNEFVHSLSTVLLDFIDKIYTQFNLISKEKSVMLTKLQEALIAKQLNLEHLLKHPLLQLSSQTNSKYVSHIEDYEIIKQIGVGGFGRIDLIKDKITSNIYALKTTLHQGIYDTEVALLKMCSHPNIIQYVDHVMKDNTFQLIISYCNGGDLLKHLQSKGLPNDEQLVAWTAQLASALFWLHKHKIMHRDIKLQNILINDTDLILTDFGGSKYMKANQTATVVGTPLYFSPEQYYGQEYTFKADIFSLGLVLFNMCVGVHTFQNTPESSAKFFDNLKTSGNSIKFTKIVQNSQIRQLIDSMLQFDPDKRISAADICQIGFIRDYLIKKQLPGPNTPTILVQRHFIKKAKNILQAFELSQFLTGQIIGTIMQYITNNIPSDYLEIILNIIPNYMYQSIKQQINDDIMESEYIQDIIVKQSNQILKRVSEVLNYQNDKTLLEICKGIQYNIKQISQHTIKYTDTNTVNMLIQPMVDQIPKCDNSLIIITPALYLTHNVNIKCNHLLLVTGTIFIQKQAYINIQCQNSIAVIQKHVGDKIEVEANNDSTFYVSDDIKNVLNIKNQHCPNINDITNINNTFLLSILKIASTAFPALFPNKAFVDYLKKHQ